MMNVHLMKKGALHNILSVKCIQTLTNPFTKLRQCAFQTKNIQIFAKKSILKKPNKLQKVQGKFPYKNFPFLLNLNKFGKFLGHLGNSKIN